MTNLKTIWICAQINFHKWPISLRMYTLAGMVIAFSIWGFAWISDYANAVGVAVTPWVFPFILTMPIMFVIYGTLTMFLFSDAPFMDSHTSFLIIRTSRFNWVVGQLLYIFLTGFIYSIFFVFISILVLIPNIQFSWDWGNVLKTIAFDPMSPKKYGITPMLNIGGSVMDMFGGGTATLISMGLFWLVSVFIGVLIFCLNILFGGVSGLIAAGFFTVMSYFSIYLGRISIGNIIYDVSPISWSSIHNLDWYGIGHMPSPMYAIGCLLGSILLMSVISVVAFCKKDLHIQERR